jgi:drug/metabolite transporter (DMT)-like permease
VVIAFTGMSSHFCLARALTYADATIVSPMDFLRLPFTALLGWLAYSENVDALTIAGAALILLGNLVNLRRRALKPEEAAAAS